MIKTLLIFFAISLNANAELLDKIAGVINDNVYTLSEINRIQKTISIRREISPFIYKKNKLTKSEILRLLQNNFIIKDKLSELGFIVGDDAVDSRINETIRGTNSSRDQLTSLLKSRGLTYNEYFELVRETMEFNIFQRRIIAPLVTITDQELKNYYYNMNKNNKALAYKYKVLDFVLESKKVLKKDIKRLPAILENYRKSGNIPSIYSSITTNDLGTVSDEDVPKALGKILKQTNEKSFSAPYINEGLIHIFYVDTKELAESADFQKKRKLIYNNIFMERSDKITQNWISRESLNYYILNNI